VKTVMRIFSGLVGGVRCEEFFILTCMERKSVGVWG
jgi:ABC-type thiamin/hydroxymethylpyrimidine transport system permease subunit